jgi:putative ABC transport system permease protein
MGKLLRRLIYLLRQRRFEAELAEEMEFHREMSERDADAQGIPFPRAAAQRAFGSGAWVRNQARDVWIWPLLQELMQDIRFAARLLAKDRRFTVVAVLVLGVGIGVNNMLFTILNAHTIRGLPIGRADRVLYISTVDEQGRPRGVSYPDFEDLRVAAQTFSGIAAFINAPVTIGDEGHAPERLDGTYLTANAFGIIGVEPVLGRPFGPDEDQPGAAGIVLLGNAVWQTRYAGDPQIVGRSILVNGASASVIGIIPDRSGLPSAAQIWLPLSLTPGLSRQRREARTLQVFGRLRDDVDATRARAEIDAITARLARDDSETNKNIRARVVPINQQFLGRLTDPAWRAFITVGFLVLAISCANVANLFLDRSRERTREIAIRTALGATRGRVVRQLLMEASVLAAISGLVGLGVAASGVRLFRSVIPDNVLPYWFDYSIDGRVLGMLVSVSVATVFVFGLIPAISGSKTDVNRALKDNREIGSRGTRRWTAMFLTAEFALAVVMLANIVVSLRLSRPQLPSDAAIDTSEVLTATFTLSGERYRTPDQRVEFFTRLEERLNATRGISVASVASVLPRAGGVEREIEIAGRPRMESPERVLTVAVGPRYFRTFQLAMLRGREFVDHDGTADQGHVMINERAVRLYFREQDAIGQRIAFRSPDSRDTPLEWLTVVGVAPDIEQQPRRRVSGVWDTDPVVYVPYRAFPPSTAVLLLRSNADASTLAAIVRNQFLELDRNIPLYRVRTMAGVIDDGGWNSRVSSLLINVLALIAVTLATVGLYAVTAHGVHQRTPELGLRMALGAQRRHITGLILKRALAQVSVGGVAGVACTVVWGRIFSSDQPGVGLAAVESFAMIAAVLLLLALAASLIPVFRATRLDPVAALRHE